MGESIEAYGNFIPKALLEKLNHDADAIDLVPGLRVARGLRESFPRLESDGALAFMVGLFRETSAQLDTLLRQREADRAFLDETTRRCSQANVHRDFRAADYETAIGARDKGGRLVLGPLDPLERPKKIEIPTYMDGVHVTLFGPPDTAKMTLNAMNTLHRKLPDEDPLIARLVEASGQVPRWGADNEDSKTPIMKNLLRANENLMDCFAGVLEHTDPTTGKHYALAKTGLAQPIKRIPGLALPDGNHLFQGQPMPLHLVDFALHLFHNWSRPEALVFYVPKLENEEEAAYVKSLITSAEALIKAIHPAYERGTVRVILVFENPRAIFRIREMANALHPHFLGGSLGWHDFLGSTARLFRNDPRYRIPVKADPDIVIKHIRESHDILVASLREAGGIKIGGMYGILFEDGNAASFQACMVGFIRDVVTQLKRGLDGYWVAHPSFVRIGIALVEAWRRHCINPDDRSLFDLVDSLIEDTEERVALIAFIEGPDVQGLEKDHPLYLRGVLAADLEMSDVISNDDPEEVRYNIFQALQYLADWLSGNGCVALPAALRNRHGEEVFVRIMDDLATTERSRWELWAEVQHGRVSREMFEEILQEEIQFIREDQSTATRRVQVKWSGEAERWYPIAIELLRRLVLSRKPVEFASELLLPFTFDCIRSADDPWNEAQRLCPGHFTHF